MLERAHLVERHYARIVHADGERNHAADAADAAFDHAAVVE
jgi:hypothetical protein